MAMKKVLQLCEKHGFVKPIWKDSQVSRLNFGPVGEFLVNNVRQEWHFSSVINRDDNVYPISSQFGTEIEETFNHIKGLCNGQLPFGIAQTVSEGCHFHRNVDEVVQSHAAFHPSESICLRSLLFVSPNDGRQTFYNWQQKRKMWWRQFSSHPGRFSLSDFKDASANEKDADNIDMRVNILAQFEWGPTVVETISVSPLTSLGLSPELCEALKVKDGRKQVLPLVVECSLSLEVASLAFLCDAFSDDSKRQLLRLHRRFAPFKVGFVTSPSEPTLSDRLIEVTKHVSRDLRQKGLSTLLLLPDMAKKSPETQIVRNDEMGVPFTIVLADSTLNDGIVSLYSRETTLKEQVHISKLTDYMQRLVQNK